MTINPQINNDNSKDKGSVPRPSNEKMRNSLSAKMDQIKVTPVMIGLAVIATASVTYASRYSIRAWRAYKARPTPPTSHKIYEGGFQTQMTTREAALILGIRGSITVDNVKEAHQRLIVANHPDTGGSPYLASKINEAKDKLIGKTNNTNSISTYGKTNDTNSMFTYPVIPPPDVVH